MVGKELHKELGPFIKPPEGYSQIEWFKMYVDDKFNTVELNVNKVERTYAEYRQTQNEWRGQLNDQAQTFARKESVDALKETNIAILQEIKNHHTDSFKNQEKQNEIALTQIGARLTKLELTESNMRGRLWIIPAVISLVVILANWYFSMKK